MSLKILLADDHVVVRQGLRALLEQAGLTIGHKNGMIEGARDFYFVLGETTCL